jgi:hypothetical protein
LATCAIVLARKPAGTCRFASAGGAAAGGVGVGGGGLGVVNGCVVGAGVAPIVPGPGWFTKGAALVAPPPLHDASAAASNARPASERSQS